MTAFHSRLRSRGVTGSQLQLQLQLLARRPQQHATPTPSTTWSSPAAQPPTCGCRWHTTTTPDRGTGGKTAGREYGAAVAAAASALSPRGLPRRRRPAEDGKRFVREVSRLGVKGDWRGALSLLRRAEADGASVNVIMYNAAIAALAKSGRWKEAMSILDGMEEASKGVARDIVSFSSAMDACRAAGKADEAHALLSRMLLAGGSVKPNTRCFNTVLAALAKRGQYRRALSVVEADMPGAGAKPDLRTWSTLLDACRAGGEGGHEAASLLTRMKGAGFVPDVWCYNHCLNAASRRGEWELAFGLLEDMSEAGVQPNCWSYSAAMKACVNGGEWQMVPVSTVNDTR